MNKKLLFSLFALIISCSALQAQTFTNTITVTGTNCGSAWSPANGNTFSVRNNNPVPIAVTDAGTVVVTSPPSAATFDLYYCDDQAANGLSSGTISVVAPTSTGWHVGATSVTIPSSGTWQVLPIFSGLNITVPAGKIYRFAICWYYISGSNPVFQSTCGTPAGSINSVNGVDLLANTNGISNSIYGYGSTPATISFSNGVYNYWGGFIKWKFTGKPCTDTPKAAVDAPTPVCPGRPFTVSVNPGYLDASYTWEISDNGTYWYPWPGATPGLLGDITDALNAPRWYRCRITCTASGFSYLTPPLKVDIAPFYYCYCLNAIAVSPNDKTDIGNVSVTRLPENYTYFSNGIATPSLNNNTANKQYTSFQFTVPPIVMYRDSSFQISVTEINTSSPMPASTKAIVFIDYNRDGVYQANEKAMNKVITAASMVQYQESGTFTVPHSAEIGLTGMRVILTTGTTDSCGDINGQGEVEDYLVDMRYEPCKGPVNAGVAVTSDSVLCSDYAFAVTDTTYEKKFSEISRYWQVSGDKIAWFDINDTKNLDQISSVFTGQPLHYRVKAVCDRTGDVSYSDVGSIKARDGYKCYCYSQAIGAIKDSSDIGGFTIGDYVFNTGGPHVLNALAHNKRTDHTDDAPITLYTDSLYDITVYQTEWTAVHADAKVTIFIDFNNNKRYDIPAERVFTNYTDITNFTLQDTFTVPAIAIKGVPTGMRVILNNDIAPNVPSDEACGGYMSGETHDYMVTLMNKPFPAGVAKMEGMEHFSIFPNPTTGKFHLQFNSEKAMNDVQVTVTNVTGQVISQKTFTHNGGAFSTQMDMSKQPRGVYFVELRSSDETATQKLIVE